MGKATKPAVQRRLVREWRESKLTQAAFCRSRGLGTRAFSNWVRGNAAEAVNGPMPLVEVVTHEAAGEPEGSELGWSWELIGDGLVLRGRDCDAAMIETLVAAVARRR